MRTIEQIEADLEVAYAARTAADKETAAAFRVLVDADSPHRAEEARCMAAWLSVDEQDRVEALEAELRKAKEDTK